MSCMLGSNRIVIKGIVRHWEVKKILDDLNQALLPRGYNPLYFFEGAPNVKEGGMIVVIMLSKDLSPGDRKLVKRLVEINGLKVVES